MSTVTRTPIQLLLNGGTGRMGRRISALVDVDDRFRIACAPTRDETIEAIRQTHSQVDVVVDFSSDAGAQRAAGLADAFQCPLLSGTTALSQTTLAQTDHLAGSQAVLIAPNTALGVAVTAHLGAIAARLLGANFDISIIETHHSRKKDAPSGTALRLRDAICEQVGRRIDDDDIHAVRSGEVIGEHTIEFGGPGERLRITHQAVSRDLFARGAIEAAAWLVGQKPGRYTIEQALGIER